ncbi:MAG: ATP-binding protein [Gammaproteobacteria bacterium]
MEVELPFCTELDVIPRLMALPLKRLATQYPIVTVLGPRQAGKSTLVRGLFPEMQYVNLEAPDERRLIAADPRGFLDNLSEQGTIIDEVQRLPDLISYLQVYVDDQGKNGQFILTGSHQLELHQAISQSLAGRTAILKLLPLSFSELSVSNLNSSYEEYLLSGFFPKLYQQAIDQNKYYQDYVATYLEKDVRKMINVKDLGLFQDFLHLAAGRVGQLVSYSSMSNDLGISNHTIKQWFSVLEASFITIKLRPYFENVNKRIVKSPKIYFIDPGLVCYLLGIENKTQLLRDPLRGSIFENMVIMELVKHQYNLGKDHNLFFYRDNHQNEVDILFKTASNLIPVEIKSAKTFDATFIKSLKYISGLMPDKILNGAVIYAGESKHAFQGFSVLNFLESVSAIA